MNREAINKWLDEEYGCSYTRLEELHDFYFEKYCDLKQENKQLKDNWNKLKENIQKAWETGLYKVDETRRSNGYKTGKSNKGKKYKKRQGSDSNGQ